jgi:hypothetical protein
MLEKVFAILSTCFTEMWFTVVLEFVVLVVGIPLGLKLDHEIKKRENKHQESEDRKRETEILILLSEELDWNIQRINGVRKIEDMSPLKFEYWDAIKQSGDICYIKDQELLNCITSAYYVVRFVHDWEMGAIMDYNKKTRHMDISSQWVILWERSRAADSLIKDSLMVAKEKLNSRLTNIEQ